MSNKVKVAVVGASGYSGMELLRYLLLHPHASLVAVTSRSLAGKPLTGEFPRFRGVGNADSLTFTAPDAETLKASPVPLYVHAPYLINVASANNRVRIPSRKILQDTCDAAAELCASASIPHSAGPASVVCQALIQNRERSSSDDAGIRAVCSNDRS